MIVTNQIWAISIYFRLAYFLYIINQMIRKIVKYESDKNTIFVVIRPTYERVAIFMQTNEWKEVFRNKHDGQVVTCKSFVVIFR